MLSLRRNHWLLTGALVLTFFSAVSCAAPVNTSTLLTATAVAAEKATDFLTAEASPTGAPSAIPVIGVYRALTAWEAKQRLDNETNVTVLDVREPSEFSAGRVPGAKLLPPGSLAATAAAELPDPDTVLFVYCRGLRRGKLVAEQLISMG